MPLIRTLRLTKSARQEVPPVTAGAAVRVESLEPRRLMAIGDPDVLYGNNGIAEVDFVPWDNGLATLVHALPDGRAYVAAWTANDFGLARLTDEGALDATFGDGGKVRIDVGSGDQARAIAVQPDGKVVIGGIDHSNFVLLRVHPDGRLDDTFGAGGVVRTTYEEFNRRPGSFTLYGMLLQPDGKFLAYGFDPTGRDTVLARYRPDGTLDPSFGNNGNGTAVLNLSAVVGSIDPYDELYDAVALPGGGYMLAGYVNYRGALVKLDDAGRLDTSFSDDGVAVAQNLGRAESIAAAPGGGYYVIAGGGPDYGVSLTRWDEQGNVDSTFGDNGLAPLTASAAYGSDVIVQPDGTVLASHGFSRFMLPGHPRGFEWAVFSPTGQRLGGNEWSNPSYGAGGSSIALQPDGRALFVGGSSRPVEGPLVFRYRTMPDAPKGARLDADILFVTGDAEANTVNVARDAGAWRVTIDGDEHTFPVAGVRRVDLRLLGGDDVLTVAEDAAVGFVELGTGNDIANFAGTARRTLGGDGDDTFSFNAVPGDPRAVKLEPGAGDDVAVFNGGPAAESFTLRNNAVDAPGWTVSFDDAMERLRVNAGGGDDRALLDYAASPDVTMPPPKGPASIIDAGGGNDTFTTRRGPGGRVQTFLGGEGDDRLVAEHAKITMLSFTGGLGDDRVTVDALVGQVTITDDHVSTGSGHSIALPDTASLESIALNGTEAQGLDEFIVARTAPVPTAISGGIGSDTLRSTGTLLNLAGITFDGGGQPGDAVVLADLVPGQQHTYAIGDGTVTRGGAPSLLYSGVKSLSLAVNNEGNRVTVNDARGLTALTVTGGRGSDVLEVGGAPGGLDGAPGAVIRLISGPAFTTSADTFRVRPDATADVFVFGDRFPIPSQQPATPYNTADPGDRLDVDLTGTADPRLTITGQGSGRYSFEDRRGVTFYDIETVNEPVAPAAAGAGFATGLPHALRFAFSADVSSTVADTDLQLINLTTGAPVPAGTWTHSYDRVTNVATFTFPGFANGRLPAGLYRATLPGGSVGAATGANAADVSVEFAVAPSVTGLWVDGSAWAPGFRQRLDQAGIGGTGGAGPGVRLDLAAASNTLPWSNIDTVRIRFDAPVVVDAMDLLVRGTTVRNYGIKSFAYDADTRTATWTLARALRNDRIQIDLNGNPYGGVHLAGTKLPQHPGDPNPNTSTAGLLDGEYAGTFPTGNGVAGGSFRFSLLPLPGDVNRDGRVNALDLVTVRSRLGSGPNPTPGRYSVFCDVNGDGRVDARDLARVRASHLQSLPPAPAAATAWVSVTTPLVRRDRNAYAPPRATLA